MKIEKINDNQIRCTLTSADLASRKIRISELAYGTEKARSLFRDMMQQAHNDFGFEADNIPLMIEAIPLNPDSIVLIITKVEEPEELDTRFSKFSPSSETTATVNTDVPAVGADDVIDFIQKLYEAKSKAAARNQHTASIAETGNASVDLVRVYTFTSLDDVILAAEGLHNYFKGSNTLYKLANSDSYILIVHQSGHTPEEFNKVCNLLSEYGIGKNSSEATEARLQEHGQVVISENALQSLYCFSEV